MRQPANSELTLLQFGDNSLLPLLFGEHDQYLAHLERQLKVTLSARGNRLSVEGAPEAVTAAVSAIESLYKRLKGGLPVGDGDVEGVARLVLAGETKAGCGSELLVETRKRKISPRTLVQGRYIDSLRKNELTFGIGPAGTGKTYLAVAVAVEMLISGAVQRLILSRPAVEAGERLGFLPGDLRDKVDPYLRPLYDALYDMLPGDQVTNRLGSGEIEVAPLAFMRGRTLSNAFVILDEAQNTTPMQMKMFLTRLGENSRMAVNGDLTQVDLPRGERSGLAQAQQLLAGLDGLAFVEFTETDVVRHPLVMRIVHAYRSLEEGGAGECDLFAKS
ncbi:MAG: PhoH family protein [Rhodospirillales bacterium]|nr:PhoH family protein [Rhodospirillales bacterium]